MPVTVDGLYAVGAALKVGGYRTGRAYLGIWETQHRENGYEWTDELRQAKSWATASLQRGLGPAVSAASFDVEQWATAAPPSDVTDMIIIGVMWMLRGSELAGLLIEQARTGPGARIATIELGAHKTNPGARRCERALRCTCGEGAASSSGAPVGTAICPAHALYRVLRRRGDDGQADVLAGKGPLFPGRGGRARTAADLRAKIRLATRSAGMSEHTLRRTGAQWYARRGVPLTIIQHIGRWGSQAVERYVGEALAGNSSWAALHAAGCVDAERMIGGCGLSGPAPLSLKSFTGLVAQLVATEVARVAQAPHPSPPCAPVAGDITEFVKSGRTGTEHVVKIGGARIPPERWETACGWRFGTRPHTRGTGDTVSCVRCARIVFGAAPPAQDGVGS